MPLLRRRRQSKGIIVILSFMTLAGLMLLTTVGLSRSLTDLQVAQQTAATTKAFHVAEAGIDAAMVDLVNGGCEAAKISIVHGVTKCNMDAVDVFTLPAPAGTNQTYQIFATQVVPAPNQQWKLTVESTYQSVKESVTAYVSLTPLSVFQYALFGGSQVNVQGMVHTDSYDSNLGTYGQLISGVPNTFNNGWIGTNSSDPGAITLNDTNGYYDTIAGMLSTGSGAPSTVTASGNPATINGVGYPAVGVTQLVSGSLALPAVAPCSSAGDFIADGTQPTYSIGGTSFPWTDPVNKVVEISGDLCVDNLVVSNEATVTASAALLPGSKYTITVNKNTQIVTSAKLGINPGGVVYNPAELAALNVGDQPFYIFFPNPGSTMTVETAVDAAPFALVNAAIYGQDVGNPLLNLQVEIGQRGGFFGSIVTGGKLTVNIGAWVHFNEALKTNLTAPFSGIYQVTVDQWVYNGTFPGGGGGGGSGHGGSSSLTVGGGSTSVAGGGSMGFGP